MKSSEIGGQAVIEGVMMKNKDMYAVAVRKPDGAIEIKKEAYKGFGEKHGFARLPIIRGIVAFAESMSIGMKTLTYSASFYEEEQPSKLERTFSNVFKEKAESIIMIFTVCLSIIMAIGIFMLLPFFIAEFFQKIIENTMILALLEGTLRIGIFVLYVIAVSQMEDIRKVFMYHGAEHKTINCVESGKDLTIENVKMCSKHHKRCGTSFMFIVMFVSILFFLFIRVEDVWLRMIVRILLIPIIAGISYEFIRFAGKSDSFIVSILSKPGMWLQALTTREPDESMIEVAIASVEAVFDWKEYQRKEFGKETEKIQEIEEVELEEILERLNKEKKQKIETQKTKEEKIENQEMEELRLQAKQENVGFKAVKTVPKRNTMKVVSFREEDLGVEDQEIALKRKEERQTEIEQRPIKAVKKVVNIEEARQARKERELYLASKESAITRVGMPDSDEEEDDDDILKALDRFFIVKEDGDDTL